MTREENIRAILECYFTGFKDVIIDSACKRICELKQEPAEKLMCDRNICISNEYNGIGCDECVVNKAEQEQKLSKWIPIPYELDYKSDAECSLCHEQFIDAMNYNYCPNCGCHMVEP